MAYAQQVTVTGTITSPDGKIYAGATGTAVLVTPGNAQPFFGNQQINRNPQPISGVNGFGAFSIQLWTTTTLTPAPVFYKFNITDQTGKCSFSTGTIAITGPMDISAFISAAAAPLAPCQGGGGGGGSTVPGGSNGQIQYNSSGTFGGAPGVTTNGNNLSIAGTLGVTGATTLTGNTTLGNATCGGTCTGFDTPSGPTTAVQTNGGSRTLLGDSGFTYTPSTQQIGGVSGLLVNPSLPGAFAAPTVTPGGTTGSTTWGYTIVARRGILNIAQTIETQTTTGNATLTAGNNNAISWSALTGSTCYDVYRTTAGGTPSTTGIISACQTGTSLTDTGLAADGTGLPEGATNGLTEGGWVGISNGLAVGVPFSSLSTNASNFIDPEGSLANFYYANNTFSKDGASIRAVSIVNDFIHNSIGNMGSGALQVINSNSTTASSGRPDSVALSVAAISNAPNLSTIDRVHAIEAVANNTATAGGVSGDMTSFVGSGQLFSTGTTGEVSGTRLTQNINKTAVITDVIGVNVLPTADVNLGPISSPTGYHLTNNTGLLIPDMSNVGTNTYGIHILNQAAASTATNFALRVDGGVSSFVGPINLPSLTASLPLCTDINKNVTTAGCASSGGANAALSNLSGVAINTSLIPGAVNTVALGTAPLPFKSLFLGTVANQSTNILSSATSNVTQTLQNVTDTFVYRTTTDTFTNKTFDTAATGNVFKINGKTMTAITGNTGLVVTGSGTYTPGDCLNIDANGNAQDSGSGCSGGATFGWSGVTAGTNSNAGNFLMTGNVLNLLGTTRVLQRGSAGLVTTTNGDLGYDTTNKNWHVWANAVDNLMGLLPASITPANNDCVKFTVSGSTYTLNTAGSACGGTQPTFQTNTVNNSTQTLLNITNSSLFHSLGVTVTNTSGGIANLGLTGSLDLGGLTAPSSNGDQVCSSAGVWTECTPGVVPSTQTAATYTFLSTDRGKKIIFARTSAIAATLPQAGSAGFGSNWYVTAANPYDGTETGLVTITPTTSTINGNSTLTLPIGCTAYIASDNTNFTAAVSCLPLSGTTTSINPGALAAGACGSGTLTLTGATTSMVATASPNTYPGDGNYWLAYVSAANTVTIKVCAAVAGTPTASTFNVSVAQNHQ
jgi:hypothetical protein